MMKKLLFFISFIIWLSTLGAVRIFAYGPNVLVGGTPSVSSYWASGYNANKAVDGNTSTTRWSSGSNTLPEYFTYDFGPGITYTVTKVSLWAYYDNQGGQVKDFTILGSNDDISYNVLYTGIANNLTNDEQVFVFNNSTAYRYFKIDITSNYRSDGFAGFWEIKAFEDGTPPAPTPTPTPLLFTYGSNVFVDGTPSVSSSYSNFYDASKGVDGDMSTRWSSGSNTLPEYFKYDLGPGLTKKINKISIWPYYDGQGGEIQDFTIQGSNNDSSYDIIYTGLIVTGSNNEQDFVFANSNAYRYYKMEITTNYRTDGFAGFWEIKAYEGDIIQTPTPTPANQPPVINSIAPVSLNEGDIYSGFESFTDSDSTSWIASVDYGDGTGIQPLTLNGMSFSLNHQYKDEGVYTITVNVTDNQGSVGIGTTIVTVKNVPPTVGIITVATSPVLANTAIIASANFTDPGILDTHTASWNWGDGNTTSGSVSESNGSGTVSDYHTYTIAGVYTITLTVTDNDGGVGTNQFQYVAVYNPTEGFMTGSGKYDSLAGWETQNTSATGEVKFGVSAQYLSGSNMPTGQAKVNFKVGDLSFTATSFEWLVISGTEGILKGNGTVNGAGNYTFIMSGTDGSQTGGQSLVRIKILDNSNQVIYDTQPGTADTAVPTTPLTSGHIKIH